jgi:serine/threonine-protein kinase
LSPFRAAKATFALKTAVWFRRGRRVIVAPRFCHLNGRQGTTLPLIPLSEFPDPAQPGNLLLHEGKWKIADFGIARFIEESTSVNTLEGCLSPHYAAPEQWRLEKAEVATDLYALGCIAYALISGRPPFVGSRPEDIRDQHLNKPPVELPDGTPPKLKMLVNMLLRKSPSARPSLGRVIEQLKGIEEEQKTPQAPSVIADAAARLEQKRAHEESVAAEQRTKELVRDDLAESGRTILAEIVSDLRARILADFPELRA